jgi:signal peptidase II
VNAPARAAALGAAVLAVDQATKALVRANVDVGSRDGILPGVELVHTRNTGVAFSLLQGGGGLLVVLTVLAMLAVLVFFARDPGRPGAWVPTGLLVGGAAGNLIDRIAQGSVTDFIDLPLWPAFNVADMAITFGVVALLYVLERPRAG